MSKIELLKRDLKIDERHYELSSSFDSTYSKNLPEMLNFGKASMLAVALTGGCYMTSNAEDLLPDVKNILLIKTNTSPIEDGLIYDEYINDPFNYYIAKINTSNNYFVKKDIIKEILSFKSLKNNWDGYGSIPLEIESASNVISLIDFVGEDLFCTISDFYPNSNGTITLIWKNNIDERLSVEVGNETMSYFVDLLSNEPLFYNNKKINSEEGNKLSEILKVL